MERAGLKSKQEMESAIYCRNCKQFRQARIEQELKPVPPKLWEVPVSGIYGYMRGFNWAFYCETCDGRISDCTQKDYERFPGKKPK